MSSADSSDRTERVKQLLLLVWVHGFKGNQASFADFPRDVSEAVQRRYSGYIVHSVIYPKYRTVGELNVATHNFVLWLYDHILELEREEVDKNSQMVHTSVILLGHSYISTLIAYMVFGEIKELIDSMGGMLVTDAAKEVRDDLKRDTAGGRADIKGIIGLDTPFIGIHPALVSYGMEQLDAYIDKTLLDTAAFFESSPKFIRHGLSKMGLKTPSKPNTSTSTSASTGDVKPQVPDKPVGRFEKGFTSVLSVPGTASSSEWDWTREPGFGLKKVWSEVSRRSSRSSINQGDGSSRRSSETPPVGRALMPPVLPPRPGSAAYRACSSDGNPTIAESVKPQQPINDAETSEDDSSSAEVPNGALQPLVESQLQLMGKPSPSDIMESSPADHVGQSTTTPADIREDSLEAEKTRHDVSEAVSSSENAIAKVENETIVGSATTSGLSTDSTDSTDKPPNSRHDKSATSPSGTNQSQSSGVPPPVPKRASSVFKHHDSTSFILEDDDTSLTSDQSELSPSDTTITAKTTAIERKQKQKKNWRWVKQHTEFMSSCWNVSGIARRMKAIEGMQRDGLYFVNIYTTVPPSPGRTFVSLPTIHHPTRESWKPFVHSTAADQVEAHMALFDQGKNWGYEDLIKVLGDEMGLILGEKKDEAE